MKKGAKPSLPTMPSMTTGPLQVQPDTRRDQQSTVWTRMHQRTNRGGGQSRGKRQGESTPSRPNLEQQNAEQNRATKGKTTARPPRPAEHTTPKPKPKQKTGKDTGHQRKTKAGRSEQTEAKRKAGEKRRATIKVQRHNRC